jgi:hypothetical protein
MTSAPHPPPRSLTTSLPASLPPTLPPSLPTSPPPSPRPALFRLALGGLLLAAAALPRHWLEATMLRHMLLQLPLLTAAGWLLASRTRALRAAAWCDEHGILGMTLLMFVSAYWMIPRTLELSITEAPYEAAKFISLMLLGALLPGSLRRANRIIQLFFVGNFCAMTAIAGMQYQELPQRLCNTYLLDDQAWTGTGLVSASLLIAALWSWRQWAAFANPPTRQPANQADMEPS